MQNSVKLINVLKDLSSAPASTVGSLLSSEVRKVLASEYPATLFIADRLVPHKVLKNSIVFIDLDWINGRMDTGLYESYEDLAFDIETYCVEFNHINRVDLEDISCEAASMLEDDQLEGVEPSPDLASLAEDGTYLSEGLSVEVTRAISRAFIEVLNETRFNSDPDGYKIINDAFDQPAQSAPVVRTEQEWDF